MSKNIKVLSPGACTTVQDLGRIGYQKFGIPVAGVMDEFAASVANSLVGNKKKEAVLEVTFIGPKLEFQEEMTFAIAGADLSAKLNGHSIQNWQSHIAKAGDTLSFGGVKKGVRAYIAFAGSIEVPLVNGSKSTLMKSKMGGFHGRMLAKGDELEIAVREELQEKRVVDKYIPDYSSHNKIRVCLGPQDDYFTEKGIKSFFSSTYKVTAQADRMGIRLEGEALEHTKTADIISDAAVIGSIQVPANGQPIVLMADRQTTGGYTKIAAVIKEDICKLAQMQPGSSLEFVEVSMEEAQLAYLDFYKNLKEIKLNLEDVVHEEVDTAAIIDAIAAILLEGDENMRQFKVSIDGRVHMVEVEEIGGNAAAAPVKKAVAGTEIAKEKVSIPVSGNLKSLAVKEGDQVKEGDLLFIFEAMKMENEALSTCDGIVGNIKKMPGDIINANEVVLEIF